MEEASIKEDLLSDLDTGWANVERVCGKLSQAEMLAPGVQGEWSVKDIICHISAWHKFLLDRLSYVLTGHPPLYPPIHNSDEADRFNARVYTENKDRPLSSAIIEFRSLYQGVRTVLEALEDEQLNQPYTYDFPDDHITLLRLIRANLSEHYRDHCSALEKHT
jgi:hypothetical protein